MDQEPCHDVRRLISQLRRGTDVLLHLTPVSCMQLLDVIMLTVLILLRHDNVTKSHVECEHLMKKCLNQLDLLKLHIQQKVVSGNEEIYFKFGLTSINSTASVRTWSERLDAFVIIGSLVFAVNKEYKLCIDYLKQGSDAKNSSFQFLINYIRGKM